ncbi:4-hydroxy-2,2'-bipyrrole-5-methanol dehydrogenase [Burkholderiaceae bacterium]|nr:4-hydroxy-2,2'-bipyrrole-5-methanol dehydrogenase [Burkholderiaceae bacterium]
MDAHQLGNVLSRVAATAALAPSSHNCQPWRLVGLARAEFEAEMRLPAPAGGGWSHALLVGIDRRRALSALPSLEREMRISVGGFASLLLNLLRLAGFSVQSQFIDSGWQAATPAGRMRLDGSEAVLALYLGAPPAGVQPMAHPLAQWIAQRHTVRGPFLRCGGPPAGTRCLPHRLADDDGLAWRHVPHGELFDKLCTFYRRCAPEDFRHGAAWRETYRHLDFSAEPPHAGGTGMNIQSLFGPLPAWRRRLYQLMLHPTGMRVAGPLGLHRRIGRDFEELVRSSGAIVYLCAKHDDHDGDDERRSHLLAGERITELWLGATRDGQALHPLSVALQHPHIESRLRSLLGCSRPILFIARVGTPAAPAPAYHRRRAPEDFCSFDFTPRQAAPLTC